MCCAGLLPTAMTHTLSNVAWYELTTQHTQATQQTNTQPTHMHMHITPFSWCITCRSSHCQVKCVSKTSFIHLPPHTRPQQQGMWHGTLSKPVGMTTTPSNFITQSLPNDTHCILPSIHRSKCSDDGICLGWANLCCCLEWWDGAQSTSPLNKEQRYPYHPLHSHPLNTQQFYSFTHSHMHHAGS